MKMNTSNEYLKTLLNPTQFISDIPDDIMIRHINRSETITYNLKSGTSGTGLIVFYPNTPSSIAGFHYKWDATNSVWVFDQYIYTAQELKKSYDYGRLISGAVSVKSSTLPAGVYALNGTFNAVWFQGTLSEVTDLNYDRILSITSNPLDKVGNVLVGDGLAILSLPQGFNNPYVRLGDESPSSLTSVTHITNTSQNLGYGGAFSVPQTKVAGQATFVKEFNINVDSVGPIDVTWSGQMTMQDEWTVTANYQPLNLSGTLITGSMRTIIWSNVGVSNGAHYMNLNEMNVSFFHENPPPEPVAAIKVHLTFGNNTNGESTMKVDGSFTFHVVGGATIGVNSPTVMIGYQGVAEGTAITISGVNNYELVPNPALQKNLPMTYGTCDPTDLTYVKYILSHRERLGIRSVMTLADYARLKMQMHVMTEYRVDDREAASFDFWNLLKQIKKLAVPVASTMLPQFAPIIGAADNLANAVMGNSASGQPIGNSASGLPISMTRRIKSAHSADTPIGESNWKPNESAEFNKLDVIYDVSHSSMALFPVIMMDNDQVVPSDPEELFIAVSLTESLRKQIPGIDEMPYYTVGGHRVYNAVSNGQLSTAPFLNKRLHPPTVLSIIRRKTGHLSNTKQGDRNVAPACIVCSRRAAKAWHYGEGSICRFHRLRCRTISGRSFWHQPEIPIDGLPWDSSLWELERVEAGPRPIPARKTAGCVRGRSKANPPRDPEPLDCKLNKQPLCKHQPIPERQRGSRRRSATADAQGQPIPGRRPRRRGGPSPENGEVDLRRHSQSVPGGWPIYPKLTGKDSYGSRFSPPKPGTSRSHVRTHQPRPREGSGKHGDKGRHKHQFSSQRTDGGQDRSPRGEAAKPCQARDCT
uniref:PVP2-VP4N-X polyprotein n=1 Tax=Culicine-associated Z virus TaxID=1398940 RepID=U3PTK8_9VIRU|nr:pVP2-VP4N-X polyprotein [Culicine-associated Z virus]